MALNRKYAALPDLDNAPDIYETPELTDDNSTVLTAAARTHSDDEFYEIDDESQGISRAGLRINEARSRFAGASEAEFADRVDGKRRSYRASGRRQRALQGDDPEELGDLSDDEIGESLERKIARLKREVEEAREEYAKRRDGPPDGNDGDAVTRERGLDFLSQALDGLFRPAGIRTVAGAPPAPAPAAADGTDTQWTEDGPADNNAHGHGHGHSYTITYAPTYEQTHALAKAADFDRRLLFLEQSLGISSSSISEASKGGLPRAILPTLDSLDKQISTLSSASTANLDSISRRVRALAADQEKLNESREKAKALREELGKHVVPAAAADDSEQETKINALYAILPTIESLTPMLPPLLDRLRSLRAIHADAATAGQTLDRVEKQQAEMARELKMWRDGLDKLEGSIKAGDETMKGNVGVMEGWVKDLEQRLEKFLYP
ncbi:Dynactin subunit 2-B [Escovopsis weberi]|uniref:Dynactin subunit 2-B n=1 Tax=Escovopsis weberi TaxID=150374 RepID=A0A0M8N0B5_ESCWE|nr:Dynactin subunit 2-B [Escovopsis weberi]